MVPASEAARHPVSPGPARRAGTVLERLAAGGLLAVAVIVALRLLWYTAVVVGVPLMPPRDDQAAREAAIQAIQDGDLPESGAANGQPIIRLPPGWADLSSGGSVGVYQEQPLVIAFYAHLAIGRCPSGPCGPDTPGGSSVTPPTPTPTSSSPGATPVPSDDAPSAAAIALVYESARADGSWPQAWALLSDYSRVQAGSLVAYEQDEAAYNLAGGSRFIMQPPTQDPDFLGPAFLGQAYLDAQAHGDGSRAWLVFVVHPDVQTASAGTTGLLIVPVDGRWLVWIAH